MKKLFKRLKQNKKPILSFLLAIMLMFSFNYMPISVISNYVNFSDAYKSSTSQSYYTKENESYIDKGNYPASLQKFFEGSSNNFNIKVYYDSRFEELLGKYAHEFLKYWQTSSGSYVYPYEEYLEYLGFDDIYSYYKSGKTNYKTFQKYLEEFIMTEDINFTLPNQSTGSTDNYTITALPELCIKGEENKFRNLSFFYNAFANKLDGKNEAVTGNDRNDNEEDADIPSTPTFENIDDFYAHSVSFNRLKTFLDDEIVKTVAIYTYDGKTQDKNVAGIIADGVPISSSYYYSDNSYESTKRPKVYYEKVNVGTNKVNKAYYFGTSAQLLPEISNSKKEILEEAYKNGSFVYENVSELQNNPLYYERITDTTNAFYIDENHPVYYKYVSSESSTTATAPFTYVLLNSKTYFDIYVLTDDDSESFDILNNSATLSSLHYKKITQDELNSSSVYVQIPYFGNNVDNIDLPTREYYFNYIFNLIGYKNSDGSYFKNYCKLFTKDEGGKLVSRIYLKHTEESLKYVYMSQSDYDSFKTTESFNTYAYKDYIRTLPASYNKNDYEAVKSTDRGYYLSDYSLYFEKTKVNYTSLVTDGKYTGEYETKYVPNIPYVTHEIPDEGFLKEGLNLRVFVMNNGEFDENSQQETIGGVNYSVIKPSSLESERNFYVKVPTSVSDKLNNKDDSDASNDTNYSFYYKHASKTVKQIYIYTKETGAENNEVYKNLYYEILKPSDFDSSLYTLVKSDDENYNKNFTLYYKYSYDGGEVDLADIFVQNKISGGNAIYIAADNISSSEQALFNSLNYTVISTDELKMNSEFYVLISENDDNHSNTYKSLYYKYQPKTEGGSFIKEKVVYLYSSSTSTTYKTFYNTNSGYVASDYELVTPLNSNGEKNKDFVEGLNLYYKKIRTESSKDISKDNYFYYKSTSTTKLEANSYYVLSFYAYTLDAEASVYVKDANGKVIAKVEHITTGGKWQKQYVFISTDTLTTSTVSLYLYMGDEISLLGSAYVDGTDYTNKTVTGKVLFDEITITKINQTDYNKKSIDDKPVLVEDEENKGNYIDDYKNTVVASTVDLRTKSEIDVWSGATNWTDMFDFDESSNLQNLIGTEFANNDEDKTTTVTDGSLKFDENVDVLADYTSLWQYYISRNLADQGMNFQLKQYKNAYANGELTASIIDESIIDKTVKEDEDEPEDKEDDKDDDKKEEIKTISSTFRHNNKVLKLENSNKLVSLGLVSNSFNIKQNEYYKITVWIYSPDKEASATISVVSVLKTANKPVNGTLLSASTSAEANMDNYTSSQYEDFGWIPVTMYIEGSALQDQNCNLVLSADKNSTVYFDNITIEKTTSAAYDKITSDSDNTTAALSLSPSSSLIPAGITNGNFNLITKSAIDTDYTKPYTAESWTAQTNSSSNVVAGIVPTSKEYTSLSSNFFTNYHASAKEVLNDPKTVENIYGIYAPSQVASPLDDKDPTLFDMTNRYKIYSNSISLSASKVYEISFEFYATSSFKGNVVSNIYYSSVNSSNIIASISESDYKEGWNSYTYYIATNLSSCTIYIEVGVENATGVSFFQKVNSKTNTSSLNEIRDKLIGTDNITDDGAGNVDKVYKTTETNAVFIDLSASHFTINDSTVNENTNVFDSKEYSVLTENKSTFTLGKNGVAVATWYSSNTNSKYTVKINEVEYYLFNDGNGYKLYEDEEHEKVVNKIGGKDVVVHSNKKVTVGTDENKKSYTTTETKTTTYEYKFDKDLYMNNVIVPANELNNANSQNVLVLANSFSTDYSVASPVYTTALATKAFYALKIYVKTSEFESSKDDFGLNINVNGTSTNWTKINTNNVDEDKKDEFGFVCYQVLIQTNTSSIAKLSVEFSLGSESVTGKGYAIISGVELESFKDEEAFKTYASNFDDDDTTIKRYFGTPEKDDKKDDDESESATGWATFFYIFSSLLLGAALIIALVAVILKKHPIKINKKEANDHDRESDGYITTTGSKDDKFIDVKKSSKKNDEPETNGDEGFV